MEPPILGFFPLWVVEPITWPIGMPPPAIKTDMAAPQCSRLGSTVEVESRGVRPIPP